MSEEKIREIALEFFKDKFGVMYKKQKELEKKLDELSDCDVSNKEYDPMLFKRLEKLEELHKSMLGDAWSDEHT